MRKLRAQAIIYEDPEAARDAAEADYMQRVDYEVAMNVEQGLPGYSDPGDLFDLDGREYRRRVESADEWNRPELRYAPPTYGDGGWKSIATETLAALGKEEVAAAMAKWQVRGGQMKKGQDRSDNGMDKK